MTVRVRAEEATETQKEGMNIIYLTKDRITDAWRQNSESTLSNMWMNQFNYFTIDSQL